MPLLHRVRLWLYLSDAQKLVARGADRKATGGPPRQAVPRGVLSDGSGRKGSDRGHASAVKARRIQVRVPAQPEAAAGVGHG